MKLGVSHRREEHLTNDHLRYLRQMGVEQVEVRISRARADLNRIREIKSIVEQAGLELFEIMLYDLYSSPAFALDLPGRESDIDEFVRFIENLGRAGIEHTTCAWCTGGVYKTGEVSLRDCVTRDFRLQDAVKAAAAGDSSLAAAGRIYSEEEMWWSYTNFMETVLPVAERCGVRLQLHPNDPPVDHGGIPRIFRSTAAFRRAMEIAGGSPYSSILFCVGCWAEMSGPDGDGEDIGAALSEFVRSGHVHQLHFRNVSSPMPGFTETFIEDGYVDMRALMQILVDSGYTGMVVPDHVPRPLKSDAGRYGTEAYLLGYMRSMIDAVTGTSVLSRPPRSLT